MLLALLALASAYTCIAKEASPSEKSQVLAPWAHPKDEYDVRLMRCMRCMNCLIEAVSMQSILMHHTRVFQQDKQALAAIAGPGDRRLEKPVACKGFRCQRAQKGVEAGAGQTELPSSGAWNGILEMTRSVTQVPQSRCRRQWQDSDPCQRRRMGK